MNIYEVLYLKMLIYYGPKFQYANEFFGGCASQEVSCGWAKNELESF